MAVQLAASTGLALRNYGLTVVSATGNFALDNPIAGLTKTVVSDGVTCSITGNGALINAATGQTLEELDVVELVGISTGVWAVVALSTA